MPLCALLPSASCVYVHSRVCALRSVRCRVVFCCSVARTGEMTDVSPFATGCARDAVLLYMGGGDERTLRCDGRRAGGEEGRQTRAHGWRGGARKEREIEIENIRRAAAAMAAWAMAHR